MSALLASPVQVRRGRYRGGGSWEMATRPPPALLRPHVADYCGYVETSPGPLARREYPWPRLVLIFELGPPIAVFDCGDTRRFARHPGGFVAGLADAFTLTEHAGFQSGIQVNLTPLGARLLFGLPLSELFNRAVAVRDALPGELGRLGERLADLPTWQARFDLVDQALARRLSLARGARPEIFHALARIEAADGQVEVADLADSLSVSRKHLVHLFRDQVGLPPKLFARIVRFDRFLAALKRAPHTPWVELAAAAGYSDQSHLVREVRAFTGATPTALRATLPTFGVAPDAAR